MESIADTLKRRMKEEVGASRWEPLAEILNERLDPDDRVTYHSLRKIAYGERPNLGLKVAQALLDFFAEVDSGKRQMPEPKVEKA